jgi:DNA replication protein DnaC
MEWGEVFGDQMVASALLDRLVYYRHVLTTRSDS